MRDLPQRNLVIELLQSSPRLDSFLHLQFNITVQQLFSPSGWIKRLKTTANRYPRPCNSDSS
jgi:hypothetical protein